MSKFAGWGGILKAWLGAICLGAGSWHSRLDLAYYKFDCQECGDRWAMDSRNSKSIGTRRAAAAIPIRPMENPRSHEYRSSICLKKSPGEESVWQVNSFAKYRTDLRPSAGPNQTALRKWMLVG